MSLITNIEKLSPRLASEITACLQPVRVGGRTIRAMRRAWTVHDITAIDLMLQELGWRLITIDENVGRVDPNREPLFQVVPIPLEQRPPMAGDLPCETCGHWSSGLVEGMCPSCRTRFGTDKTDNDRREGP